MAKFDGSDSVYTKNTTPARGDLTVTKDISETLPEDQTKYALLEDLVKYGSFASKVRAVTASGNVTLLDTDPIFIEIDPNGSNRDCTCPAKGDDNHPYIIRHSGSANTITIKKSGGTTITTLAAGEVKYIVPSTLKDFEQLTVPVTTSSGGGVNFSGRLTPTSGKPIERSNVTAAGSIYWEPYEGDMLPLWGGSAFTLTALAAMTLTLNNPNHAADTNYPVFIFDDGGTKRIGTGPAWTSGTARGTGAGTGELEYVNGIAVNKVSMTVRNGSSTYTVAARYGTHVGDILISATVAQVNFTSATQRGVWNRYNRKAFSLFCYDPTNTWNYTIDTNRAANGDTTLGTGRVSIILGEAYDECLIDNYMFASNPSSVQVTAGIGIDSTTVNSAQPFGNYAPAANGVPVDAHFRGGIAAGSHYIQRLEKSTAAGTTTWYGDSGSANVQTGMYVTVWM